MMGAFTLLIFTVVCMSVSGFHFSAKQASLHRGVSTNHNGVRSLKAVLDAFAGFALANQLNNAPLVNQRSVFPTSALVAVVETKQGFYKEYSVEEKVDDSALDEIKRGYKTAEETDEGKNKYWAILAVLVAGSFVIPMVQYYWYVAEEE